MPGVPPPHDSQEPFLCQRPTLDALSDLSNTKQIVIYCGAGVSIDRTGVGWAELVRDVANKAASPYMGLATRPAAKRLASSGVPAVQYLLQNSTSPRAAASIVVEKFRVSGQSENDFLASKVKDILYEKHGWSRGYMLRNLIRLSISAAMTNRHVTIITSNYDVYLEKEFQTQLKDLIKTSLPSTEYPGMRWRTLGSEATSLAEAGENATSIELVYIHGRVDESAHAEGTIVMSEVSYAITRKLAARELKRAFSGREKGVLIVGASLTDEPLVNALADTRDEAGQRVALVSMPSMVDEGPSPKSNEVDTKTLIEAFSLRGLHLKVQILYPMSYHQSSQFLEELRVSYSAIDKTAKRNFYAHEQNGINYAARLNRWNKLWRARAQTNDASYANHLLSERLENSVRLRLTPHASTKEGFRVEVWARDDLEQRHLTLWANSTGPIMDRSVLRHEPIRRETQSASVMALMAGRPLLLGIEDLGIQPEASRWKTFFSMPIFVLVDFDISGIGETAYVPAGALTLATTMSRKRKKGVNSVFREGVLSQTDMEELKLQLISVGREILGTTDVVKANPQAEREAQ